MKQRHLSVALAVSLATLTLTTKTFAQDSSEASERFERGVKLYRAGDIRAALIEFERAYELEPNHKLLFNIGQASAELNDYVRAYRSFKRYLRDGGKTIGRERRAMVRREIRRLRRRLAKLDLSVSVKSAEVSVDGLIVGVAPLRKPLLVNAGRRRITVTAKGFAPWERQLDLAGEDERRAEVELSPLVAPRLGPLDDLNPRSRTQSTGLGAGFYTSAALTVALGIGTGVASVMTLRSQRDHARLLAAVPASQASLDESSKRVRRNALVTDIGLGLTGICAIGTIVFLFRASDRAEAQAEAVNVSVGPRSVAFRGHF